METPSGHGGGVDALNRWLARLPRTTFDVGGHRVPAFRSLGIVGFHVAVVLLLLTALSTGVPMLVALGVAGVSALSFFSWGLVRRALTRREVLVLLEHVWVAYAAVAVLAWLVASGDAAVRVVDLFSVAVGPFLAFGRLGCATVGCCHGHPCSVGLRYGPEHGLRPRMTDRPLFPVQLLEAVALLGITAVAFRLVTSLPGTATVWFLSSYAVVRFGLQRLRADHATVSRSVPVAQVMCVVQLAAAVSLDLVWLHPSGTTPRTALVVGVVMALTLAGGVWFGSTRRRSPLTRPEHLDEVWCVVTAASPRRRTTGTEAWSEPWSWTTTRGMVVAVSEVDEGRHVSFSHPTAATLPVALWLGLPGAFTRNGVTHARLGEDPAPEHASRTADYFTHGPSV